VHYSSVEVLDILAGVVSYAQILERFFVRKEPEDVNPCTATAK